MRVFLLFSESLREEREWERGILRETFPCLCEGVWMWSDCGEVQTEEAEWGQKTE